MSEDPAEYGVRDTKPPARRTGVSSTEAFDALVSEMDDVLTALAGQAELLSARYEPELRPNIRENTERYRRIVTALSCLYGNAIR